MKLIVRLGQGRTPMSNHGMNNEVIISCAVTGAGDTVGKHPAIPVTPRQIADAAIEAAKAGAAIAHLHVRNVETGKAGRDLANYREAVQLVRESGTDVVINLTAGMGGDFVYDPSNPSVAGSGSDMIDAAARLAHVEDTRPEICTLDCGSLNFGNGAYIATADLLRDMAARIQKMGVKPEIEAFELGHIWLAKQLIAEGLIDSPPLFQICLGIPTMRNHLPADCNWAGFAIGRNQMGFVAQSMLLGGNVRVGLEDNIWLDKGVHATNGTLVARAKEIVERLGGRTLTPAEARIKLGLKKQR